MSVSHCVPRALVADGGHRPDTPNDVITMCRVCGASIASHCGRICGVCGDPVEHHTDDETMRIEIEGRARMAAARQAARLPLDGVDRYCMGAAA